MTGRPAVTGTFETLGDLIVGAAPLIADCEAYVEVATRRRMTFAELGDAAAALATRLRSVGVERGDVVAICLGPSIDYAVACFAGALVGAVVTGINIRLGPREISAIFDRCQPSVVIRDDGFRVPEGHSPRLIHRRTLADLPAVSLGTWKLPDQRTADDPAVIIWTSGTTGTPKGAWLDHRNLSAAVQTAGEMTVAFDRRLFGMPMAHAGYMAKLWEQWAMGVALVLTPTPWSAATMLEVLTTERITAGGGVPTQWSKLLEVPGVETADLSALRICLAATAPAAPELIERMATVLGAPVVVRYAMTESPSISGTRSDDPPEVQYRTVGRPQDVSESGSSTRPGSRCRRERSGGCRSPGRV